MSGGRLNDPVEYEERERKADVQRVREEREARFHEYESCEPTPEDAS